MTSKISGLPPISTTADLSVASGRKAETAKKEPTAAADTDSVQLTAPARVLGEGSADAPVDVHRVERLRQSIADGSYRVDADRIAGALLDIERTSKD